MKRVLEKKKSTIESETAFRSEVAKPWSVHSPR